jgi:PAS domain S-box-containing protein
MQQDQYRFLFESLDRGVVFHGPDGFLTDANEAAARILGVPRERLIGRHSEDGTWRSIHEDGSPFPGEEHPAMVVFRSGREIRNVIMGVFNNPKGEFHWIRIDALPWYPEGPGTPMRVCVTFEDITDLIRYREEIRINETRLKSLIRIQQHVCDTVQEFLDYALEEAIQLTASRIGYIYHYSEATGDFTLNTWSKGVMAACSINQPQTLYHLEKTGIWGEAVRQRKPIMVNDFHAPHHLKKGYPEGHAPLYRFLTVPVFNDNEIVAVVGVANKESDYTETDILQLTLLMENVWKETEKKRAEEDLRINQEYQSQLLELAPDAFFHGDTRGVIIGVNNRAVELTGFGREFLSGKPMKDIFAAASLEEKPLDYESLKQGKTVKNERILQRSDGSLIPIEMSSKQMPDGSYQSFIRDISDRKRAEEQLENSRIMLEQALNQSPIPMVLVSMPDGVLRIINPACLEFLGMQDEPDWVGTPLSEYRATFQDLDLDGKPGRLEDLPLARSLRGEVTTGKERIIIRKDGTSRREMVYAMPIRGTRGEIIAGFLLMVDITRAKMYEEELKRSEAQFRRLFDQSPLGAVIVGLDLRFQKINEAFCRMLGYREEDLAGRTFSEITVPETIERDRMLVGKLLANELEHFSVDKQYIRKDGSLVWARTSVRVIRDEAAKPLFLLPVIEDIEERKYAEEELVRAKEKAEESDRLKTAFLNNISHEIRTPLNGLLGFSGCLLDRDLAHDEQESYVEIIETCGKQLLSIIDDIVSIALIDAGQARFKPVRTDLVVLIENLYKQFLPMARQRGVLLVPDCRLEGHDFIRTDETKLVQILSNLLHNSLKFCREGTITLSCRVEDDSFCFAVSDTGIGISPDKQAVIFERFRQADETISQEFGGTGLGLSIAKAYTELLGGQIRVTSSPGKGARFSFELPVDREDP